MSGALKVLSIELLEDDPTPVETTSSVEGFLKACSKIKDLCLVLATCPLVGKDYLLSHADTLRSLVVSTWGPEQRVYSKQDLGSILKACKRLKCLAINFPRIRLGSVTKPGRDLRFNESEEGAEGLLVRSPSPTVSWSLLIGIAGSDFAILFAPHSWNAQFA
jgi:hypothetical protein